MGRVLHLLFESLLLLRCMLNFITAVPILSNVIYLISVSFPKPFTSLSLC